MSELLDLGLARRPVPEAFRPGADYPTPAWPPDRDHEVAHLADNDDGEDVPTVIVEDTP